MKGTGKIRLVGLQVDKLQVGKLVSIFYSRAGRDAFHTNDKIMNTRVTEYAS